MEAGLGRWAPWSRRTPGVPTSDPVDDVATAVQPLLSLAIALLCLVTVRPLGLSGTGLYGSVLLVLNVAFTFSRTLLPDRLVPDRWRLLLAVLGALAAGLVLGYDSSSVAPAFAFVIAMHAGIRFEPAVALAVTAVAAVVAMVLLALTGDASAWPWWTAFFLFGPTLAGINRRNRTLNLQAAHQLVEQTRLAAESESRAGALAERARIARDIHDVLAHSLSGVNMQLQLADALFEAGRDDEARDAVRRSQGLVVDGLGEARRAVQALREDTVELVPSLERMVTGSHEVLEVRGEPVPLGAEETQALVRTAQEALTNARRHAPGAAVRVVLAFDGPAARLDVDNAAGTQPGGPSGSGLGLVGMRERAALLGGRLEAGPVADPVTGPVVGSEGPQGGWRVRLELPGTSR